VSRRVAPGSTISSRRPSPRREARTRNFSAGVVPIYRGPNSEDDLFLILRCYNYWDFPKGGVNPNETPLEAALRELKEETTLERIDFKWDEVFRETPPYGPNKIARYYVGLVDRLDVSLPINPLLGRPEHHEFRWLTAADARPLLNERIQTILTWAKDTSAPETFAK
jgi:8-oxo-dGTP pyrophosphatase MutT (NUDIX family)